MLCADVLEQPVSSIFIGGVGRKNNLDEICLYKYPNSLFPVIFPAYTTYEGGTVFRNVGT
jgi:hypothetical protein